MSTAPRSESLAKDGLPGVDFMNSAPPGQDTYFTFFFSAVGEAPERVLGEVTFCVPTHLHGRERRRKTHFFDHRTKNARHAFWLDCLWAAHRYLQILHQAVEQRVNPAVDMKVPTTRPGLLYEDVRSDVPCLSDDIEFAQTVEASVPIQDSI
jgi:hypothetical protein